MDVIERPKFDMTDFMKEDVKFTLWTHEIDMRL